MTVLEVLKSDVQTQQQMDRPVIGDVLRVIKPLRPVILGYGKTGEERNMESPAGRILETIDFVPSKMPVGTLLKVVQVDIARYPSNGGRMVWVRAEPMNP